MLFMAITLLRPRIILKTTRQPQSPVPRQEAEGLRKSLEHSDAYFLVQQQALEDFSTKQDKANQLAKLIASMVDTQDNVS